MCAVNELCTFFGMKTSGRITQIRQICQHHGSHLTAWIIPELCSLRRYSDPQEVVFTSEMCSVAFRGSTSIWNGLNMGWNFPAQKATWGHASCLHGPSNWRGGCQQGTRCFPWPRFGVHPSPDYTVYANPDRANLPRWEGDGLGLFLLHAGVWWLYFSRGME